LFTFHSVIESALKIIVIPDSPLILPYCLHEIIIVGDDIKANEALFVLVKYLDSAATGPYSHQHQSSTDIHELGHF
jgi:hypothetical protein